MKLKLSAVLVSKRNLRLFNRLKKCSYKEPMSIIFHVGIHFENELSWRTRNLKRAGRRGRRRRGGEASTILLSDNLSRRRRGRGGREEEREGRERGEERECEGGAKHWALSDAIFRHLKKTTYQKIIRQGFLRIAKTFGFFYLKTNLE